MLRLSRGTKSRIAPIFLFAVHAISMKPGDVLQFQNSIRGHTTADVRAKAKNGSFFIEKDTSAKLLESISHGKKGTYSLKIEITSGEDAGKSTWVYFDPNNPSLRLYDKEDDEKPVSEKAETDDPGQAGTALTLRKVEALGEVLPSTLADPIKTPESTSASAVAPDPVPAPVPRVAQPAPKVESFSVTLERFMEAVPAGPTVPQKGCQDDSIGHTTAVPEDPYLRSTEMVQSEHPEIVSAAKQITQGLSDPVSKSRAIHQWIAKNIRYDGEVAKKRLARIQENSRQDALFTLQSRTAVCEGYADLAAALHRAVGIPARVAIGDFKFGYSSPKMAESMGRATAFLLSSGIAPRSDTESVFHAWNEVYLNGRWVSQDPTAESGLPNGINPISGHSGGEFQFFDIPESYYRRVYQKSGLMDR